MDASDLERLAQLVSERAAGLTLCARQWLDAMQEPNGLNPAEHEVEEALRTVTPSAARIDPVAAAFAAGQRSATSQLQRWRAAAAVLLLVSAGSWLLPASDHDSDVERSRVSIALVEPIDSLPHPSAQSLLALRYAVFQHGIEGLPTTPIPASRPVRSRDLL
jgi:hypothetical protein